MNPVELIATGAAQLQSVHSQYQAAELSIRTVSGKELAAYVPAWKLLANRALAPNPFYEPWMLLPAIEHLGASAQCQFLLVFGPVHKRTGDRDLLGLFPLEVQSTCLHLPIRTLSFWQHPYCFLTVPLVDRDQAWPVIEAFWRWWESGPFGCHVLDTNLLLAEGRFHEIWSDFTIGRTSLMLNEYARAALYTAGTFESYMAAAVSRKHLQEFDRQERKLRQTYACEYREVMSESEVDDWVDAFLAVESSGWKGAPGCGAFASSPKDAQFFRAMTRSGFAENRVMLLRLDCNGSPIALKHNLISGRCGFTFKIAFDETFSKYSPGVLLELENIRRVFDGACLEWMDSCAAARHPMADRLWSERRMIRRALYSNRSRLGDLIVSGMPLLRWLHDRMRWQTAPRHLRVSTSDK
jgi:CelD/BcsL family acetyltransferase involved in cellulose biosynthesis